MSFFTNSSGFTITGGNFTSICLPIQESQDAGRFCFHFKLYVLLTVLNTAGAKDRDNCESDDYAQVDDLRKRCRCRGIDGLMVCQQALYLIHDHASAFVIDRKGR